MRENNVLPTISTFWPHESFPAVYFFAPLAKRQRFTTFSALFPLRANAGADLLETSLPGQALFMLYGNGLHAEITF